MLLWKQPCLPMKSELQTQWRPSRVQWQCPQKTKIILNFTWKHKRPQSAREILCRKEGILKCCVVVSPVCDSLSWRKEEGGQLAKLICLQDSQGSFLRLQKQQLPGETRFLSVISAYKRHREPACGAHVWVGLFSDAAAWVTHPLMGNRPHPVPWPVSDPVTSVAH